MNALDYILVLLTILLFIACIIALVKADQRAQACDYWHRQADRRGQALENYERRHAQARSQSGE